MRNPSALDAGRKSNWNIGSRNLIVRHWKPALALTALFSWGLPAFADPTGVYSVTGINMDGGSYRGEITVEPAGDIFNLTWTIARDTFTGIGVFEGDTLSAAYDSPTSVAGVIQMTRSLDGWDGVWAYLGHTGQGTESWRPQSAPAPTASNAEAGSVEALLDQFAMQPGYVMQDLEALNEAIEQQLTPVNPDSVFWPSGSLSPFVKAVVALEAADDVLERVRYRMLYGQEWFLYPRRAARWPSNLSRSTDSISARRSGMSLCRALESEMSPRLLLSARGRMCPGVW